MLEFPGEGPLPSVAVVDPQKEVVKVASDPKAGRGMRMPTAKHPGVYQVDSTEAEKLSALYAANIPDAESSLQQIEPTRIEEMLEKGRVSIVRDLDSMERAVSKDRIGRELFAPLMLLLLIVITAEGWFASRFYKQPAGQEGPVTRSEESAISTQSRERETAGTL